VPSTLRQIENLLPKNPLLKGFLNILSSYFPVLRIIFWTFLAQTLASFNFGLTIWSDDSASS